MKILYIHQYFKLPNESGGTRSFDLATSFISLGHRVEMVTSTSNIIYKTNKRWTKIEKNGLLIHYIYLSYNNDFNYLQRSIVFFKFLFFATIKILSLKSDLVIATSTPLTIGIPAMIKKWIHKTPYIFETRDIWPETAIAIGAIKNIIFKKILFILERLIYNSAEAIVPLSVDMKKSIIYRYPKLSTKLIEVIENISEINRFQYGHSNKKKIIKEKIGFEPRFTILYAGTFGLVNGIKYVIDLAEKIFYLDSSIIFILIGEGSKKNIVIEEAIKKRVLNKNVFILESVSKSELPQLYFESDMGSSFVIAVKELWANSANKFFDTLAAGKPILINYNGWQEEIIRKKNIGYVLPTNIDDKIVENFFLYTLDKPLILKQQKNALHLAKKKYALDIAVAKYNNIFNNINEQIL